MALTKTRFVVIILIVFLTMSVGIVGAAPKEHSPLTEFWLTTDDAFKNAEYGRSVAIDGNLVAVGMGGDGAVGAVYLYKRQGMIYVPEATLDFPDAIPGACTDNDPENDFGNCPEFGRTVAIQGNTVFVGARFAQAGTTQGAGAVYVFKKNKNTWRYEDKVVSPAPQTEDNFGRALAIQGNLLVVTARKNTAERGAVYVFEKKGDQYVHKVTLEASDSADGDYFGQSVGLQGSFLVIGARNTAGPNGATAGGFYLFRQKGGQWIEVTKMTPPGGKNDDQYGFAIAINGDTIVVTARRADPSGVKNAGAAYVYSLKGDSVELVTKLIASDARANDEFGQSVAFAGDVIAVGAWKYDVGTIDEKTGEGSIYLFHQKGGQWIQIGKIIASDGMPGDEFGYSLAAQGNRMVTGAHKVDLFSPDGELITDAGAAYMLTLKP